jgi:hypothetical protein
MAVVFGICGLLAGFADDDPLRTTKQVQSGASTLSISLSTNTWSIGDVPKCGVADTWYISPGTFAVTNTGSVAVRLMVTASNATPSGWVLAPIPGFDRFTLAVSIEDGAPAPSYQSVFPLGVMLADVLETNAVLRFDLRIQSPTESEIIDKQQEIPIAIVALPLE